MNAPNRFDPGPPKDDDDPRPGSHGASADEGEAVLGFKPQTYTPRRGELVALGLVVDSGRRPNTASGRPAAVWVTANHVPPAPKPEGGAA